MTYNVLTGRKELFDDAPAAAMVVLETNEVEPRVIFAVAHEMGAQYWEANGIPGRPSGLIALFKKTRVVASRVRIHGEPEPKRDVVPTARMRRMQEAQEKVDKAKNAKKPAPAAPTKPKCQCSGTLPDTHHRMCPEYREKQGELLPIAKQAPEAKIDPYIPHTSGFVSLFDKSRDMSPAVTLLKNGQMKFAKCLFPVGDRIDVQVDPARRLIRIGKVSSGGRVLSSNRQFGAASLLRIMPIPADKRSLRIELTQIDGWWQGELPK